MDARWPVNVAIALSLCAAGCWPVSTLPLVEPSSLRPSAAGHVYVLRGRPNEDSAFAPLDRVRHCLIMIPGISSGDLEEQARFLGQVRERSGADLAIFQHWGHTDPTRKVASPLATAHAAADLAALCTRLRGSKTVTIDLLAHSAGTIVVNKAAQQLWQERAVVRFRHVLFLGTPHDPRVDVSALKRMSQAILNLRSAYDKINRNVSGALGVIQALDGRPYWNQRMDTSLGGRRIRHYTFLESTPENWLQYGYFLRTGDWPKPQSLTENATPNVQTLYGLACWARSGSQSPSERETLLALAHANLVRPNPEIRYYGALLMGLIGASSSRAALKEALQKKDAPAYLRREIYQALGAIANPEDLRYLQRARKTDPASGDVLRDVLRDWKRRRIRPQRRRRER